MNAALMKQIEAKRKDTDVKDDTTVPKTKKKSKTPTSDNNSNKKKKKSTSKKNKAKTKLQTFDQSNFPTTTKKKSKHQKPKTLATADLLNKKKKKEKSKSKDEKKEDNPKRIRAIDELISTEQTYVKNLELFIELFIIPLEEGKLIKTKQMPTIFSEIKTIVQLNKNLLTTLKTNKENDTIGQAMMEFVPYFKMYSSYVNNHEKATNLLMNLTSNPNNKLSKFFNTQQTAANGQSIQSFLILPIQRIPRYELCMKEIIKLTGENNSDLNNLQLCYDKICSVNKSINAQVHEFESRQKVHAIERRFDTKISLVTPSRKYIREGIMTKICRKKDVKYLFILFSDLLIYADYKEDKKNSKTPGGPNSTPGGPNSNNIKNKLKLHNILEFDIFFKIEKLNNNRIYENNCFEIYSTRKSFLCVCENETIRNDWFSDIATHVDLENVKRENRRVTDAEIRSQEEFIRILDVAPIWIPDEFTENCMNLNCNKKFTITRRRHHCRYCGFVVCGNCSKTKLPHFLADKMHQIVRVCINCFERHKSNFPDFDPDSAQFNGGKNENFDDLESKTETVISGPTVYDWDDDYDELDNAIRQRYKIQYIPDENDEVVPDDNYYNEVLADDHENNDGMVVVEMQNMMESNNGKSSKSNKSKRKKTKDKELNVNVNQTALIPVASEEFVSDTEENDTPMSQNDEKKKKKKKKKKNKRKNTKEKDNDKQPIIEEKIKTPKPFILDQNEVQKAMKTTYRVGTICRIHSLKDNASYNNKFCRIIGFRKSQPGGDIDIYYVKILDRYWKKMNLGKGNVLKIKDEDELNDLKKNIEKRCWFCSCFVFLFILALICFAGGCYWYFFWKKDDGYFYYGPFGCGGIGVLWLFIAFWQYLKSRFCCLCCNCCYIKSNRVICC